MEQAGYKCIYKGGTGEIEEKKSRFIATVRPVESEEEAIQFINEIKKQYWDARHNCSAFVIGENHELSRCSDDGEPSGTAGRPMLEVLLREDIHNVAVVVTRYFGGTLLGTGGLVRAYQKSVQEGIRNSVLFEKQIGRILTIDTDYTGMGKLQYLFGNEDIQIMDIRYSDIVVMDVVVGENQKEAIESKIVDLSNGQAKLEWSEKLVFAMIEKEIKIFGKTS
jgi:uncharacterized YigZ family protein